MKHFPEGEVAGRCLVKGEMSLVVGCLLKMFHGRRIHTLFPNALWI